MSKIATATMTMSRDVTGRDGYIIAQALHVAAKALLAEPFPEERNAQDMHAILEAVYPGELVHLQVLDRIRDGVRFGLKLAHGMRQDEESVEAWIKAGIAERDLPAALMASALAEAVQMKGHLSGRIRLSGLSDHDAKKRLLRAQSTIRLLSGANHIQNNELEDIRISIGSDFHSESVWRDGKHDEFPEDDRNAVASEILDNLESDIGNIPDELLLRFQKAWANGDLIVSETWSLKLKEVGFVTIPASAQEFVEVFLSEVEPSLAESAA